MPPRRALLGGLSGVWLSSLLYGALLARPAPLMLLPALATLPLAYLAWRPRPRDRLLPAAAAALLSLPVALHGLPASLAPSVVLAALLPGALASSGTPLIVSGGLLVAGPGALLAALSPLAREAPQAALAPLAYHLASISQAAARAQGPSREAGLGLALGSAATLLVAASLPAGPAGRLVLGLDAAARLAQGLLGDPVAGRLSLRAYGVVETLRISLVLGLAGALL